MVAKTVAQDVFEITQTAGKARQVEQYQNVRERYFKKQTVEECSPKRHVAELVKRNAARNIELEEV